MFFFVIKSLTISQRASGRVCRKCKKKKIFHIEKLNLKVELNLNRCLKLNKACDDNHAWLIELPALHSIPNTHQTQSSSHSCIFLSLSPLTLHQCRKKSFRKVFTRRGCDFPSFLCDFDGIKRQTACVR